MEHHSAPEDLGTRGRSGKPPRIVREYASDDPFYQVLFCQDEEFGRIFIKYFLASPDDGRRILTGEAVLDDDGMVRDEWGKVIGSIDRDSGAFSLSNRA